MIVNLIREPVTFAQAGELACSAEAPGVPAHRVAATPFDAAEREVRRRVLRSLADRENPPTAVVFVRTWEQQTAVEYAFPAPTDELRVSVVHNDAVPPGAVWAADSAKLAEAVVRDGAPPPAEGRRGRRR